MRGRAKEGGRYWQYTIWHDHDFTVHFDYIHFNPIKHRLDSYPADWPHSMFRQCLAAELDPAGWIGNRNEPQHTVERQ